jgi:hypothetical protein
MNHETSTSAVMKILSLQKLFSNAEIIKKLIDIEFVEFIQQIQHYPSKCKTDIFSYWSVIIKDITIDSVYSNIENCTCSLLTYPDIEKCDGCTENYALPEIHILIKPEIDDDHAHEDILQEMKIQMEINNMYMNHSKKKFLIENASAPGLKEYIARDTYAFKAKYVLFVNDYKSVKISPRKFVETFNKHGISVIFKEMIFC